MKLNNTTIAYIVLAVAVVVVLSVVLPLFIKRRGKLSLEQRWRENQKLLAKKATWKDAVIGADRLLDELLKKKHYKGKTMGERLVAAQHDLSSNDMVWFSHKLRNKIVNDGIEVNKTEVKQALLGFWQAMKDLGAFKKEDKEDKGKHGK